MNTLFWILVIYVTADIVISAYVVYQRGGIKATISEIRCNLGYTTDVEDEDDVDNHW